MKVLRLGMGMREGFHSGSGMESGQFVHHSLGCVCSHSDVTCKCSVQYSIEEQFQYHSRYKYVHVHVHVHTCIRCTSIKDVHVNVECK